MKLPAKPVIMGIQLLLGGLFLLILSTQTSTTAYLTNLGIDSLVLEGIPGAYQRYLYWLLGAMAVSFAFTSVDIRSWKFDTPKTNKNAITFYLVMGFFLFYLVLTRSLQFPWNQDDAYIDFRYVINWVNSISFDYNPGERAMGFTSHLHLAVLTIFALLFKSVDLPVLSQGINLGLQIISYYLTYYLVRATTESRFAGALGAILFAIFPYNIQESIGGKETSLVTACMLTGLLAMQYGRQHLAAWSSALIVLARPEGGLWMLLSLAWSYRAEKKKALKYWLLPFLFLISVAGWLYIQFGTVIPHGLTGKSIMFYKPPFLADMVLILRRLGDGCFVPEFIMPMNPIFSYVLDFFRLYGGTLVLLALIKFLNRGSLRFYSISVLAYLILFSLANPYLFPWYLAWFSLVPSLLIPVLVLKLNELRSHSTEKKNAVAAALILVYLGAVQIVEQPTRLTPGIASVSFFWSGAYKRLVIYRKAAEKARELDPEQKAVLAAPEIGVLGHYYRGPILDLGGLVSENIIEFGPPSKSLRVGTSLYAIIPESIEKLKPKFLVTDGFFGKNGLYKAAFFEEDYRVAEFYPHALWSEGIYLYERKDGN